MVFNIGTFVETLTSEESLKVLGVYHPCTLVMYVKHLIPIPTTAFVWTVGEGNIYSCHVLHA
jgi:hypothetical protein